MASNPRVLVLGAGAWGTALALTLVRNGGNEVFLWARDAAAAAAMRETRSNARYLPGIELPAGLQVVADDHPVDVDLIVAAVPFQALRGTLESFAPRLTGPACIACACKGLEEGTFARADQVVADVFAGDVAFAMLSGPNFALEVAEQRPAAITVASRDPLWGPELVKRFHSQSFRPYHTDDVVAVQLGGAVKNVMAIAAGISDGLDLGANSRAALITRGLAEIARFGTAQGGRMQTFMGLSGLGDLVLTCTDDKSRNRRFGLRLASGHSVADAIAEIGLVEGAKTATALVELASQINIEMPISEQVAGTLAGTTTPSEAVENLLSRDPVPEAEGL